MAKIIIKNGEEYDLPSNFTFREMREIKRVTGLRAGELAEGFEKGDTDVLLAFAAIARMRATGVSGIDNLMDLDVNEIRVDFAEEAPEETDPLAVEEAPAPADEADNSAPEN